MTFKKDLLMMKNGQMILLRDGQMITMKDDKMMLVDGTVVTRDGTVKMTDGTTRTLRESEAVSMDGTTTDEEDND
jgi:hypothetical protein